MGSASENVAISQTRFCARQFQVTMYVSIVQNSKECSNHRGDLSLDSDFQRCCNETITRGSTSLGTYQVSVLTNASEKGA